MFDSVNARLAAFMALFKVQIRVAQGIERRRKQERQSVREAESEQGVKSTAEERSTITAHIKGSNGCVWGVRVTGV